MVRSIENAQQRPGKELEDNKTDDHNTCGIADAQFDSFDHTVRFPGTVVVSHDGYHAVIHAKDRHKDKALQFEIDAEYGSGGGAESEGSYSCQRSSPNRWKT